MMAAFSLCEIGSKVKTLQLGTGAGVMPMFLRSQIPQEAIDRIDCVESHQGILAAAERYFGFTPNDPQIQSHCADALEHIAKC